MLFSRLAISCKKSCAFCLTLAFAQINDFNLYLQSIDRKSLHQMLATLNQHTKILTLKNKVRWYLDIDPIE
jgi:primosomal protein N'